MNKIIISGVCLIFPLIKVNANTEWVTLSKYYRVPKITKMTSKIVIHESTKAYIEEACSEFKKLMDDSRISIRNKKDDIEYFRSLRLPYPLSSALSTPHFTLTFKMPKIEKEFDFSNEIKINPDEEIMPNYSQLKIVATAKPFPNAQMPYKIKYENDSFGKLLMDNNIEAAILTAKAAPYNRDEWQFTVTHKDLACDLINGKASIVMNGETMLYIPDSNWKKIEATYKNQVVKIIKPVMDLKSLTPMQKAAIIGSRLTESFKKEKSTITQSQIEKKINFNMDLFFKPDSLENSELTFPDFSGVARYFESYTEDLELTLDMKK